MRREPLDQHTKTQQGGWLMRWHKQHTGTTGTAGPARARGRAAGRGPPGRSKRAWTRATSARTPKRCSCHTRTAACSPAVRPAPKAQGRRSRARGNPHRRRAARRRGGGLWACIVELCERGGGAPDDKELHVDVVEHEEGDRHHLPRREEEQRGRDTVEDPVQVVARRLRARRSAHQTPPPPPTPAQTALGARRKGAVAHIVMQVMPSTSSPRRVRLVRGDGRGVST